MNEKEFIEAIYISSLTNSIKRLNELDWEIQFDTLEFGKQNLNLKELIIDYENKKIIF